ncbi:XtrA/YqaO family protein [Oceanobacillus kimchii]|uniref:XtrA/YqaO family protein n=1 Tax=Oceanobacillus kimchii TaxID=746691 RepID=UPI0021A3F570|nr:XtrA/YqaO family protein [Oceanobacillus kimchii]MCT1577964.1 XtrA/YqaO family protein [Oceanobacillus kimchii]MCT2137524.1 XtrA/YqaO family protein [Oceanobacillus kimchii]
MRLKQVPFKQGKLNVDIENKDKPFVLVYSNGEAKLSYLPDHGETKVITHQGRVKRIKFDEGEEF